MTEHSSSNNHIIRRKIKIDAGILPRNMSDSSFLKKEEIILKSLHNHNIFHERQRVIIVGGMPDGEKIAQKLLLERWSRVFGQFLGLNKLYPLLLCRHSDGVAVGPLVRG